LISFENKYWFIFIPVLLLITLGIVSVLYFRNRENDDLTKPQLLTLRILRYLSFFLIAFLLLSPFIKIIKKSIQDPLIIVAWDNSESLVLTADSLEVKENTGRLREQLIQSLEGSFSVVEYSFGQESGILRELNFKDKSSDYSQLLTAVINNHYNENIGALIVAGDGTYNRGKNPVNMLQDITFPVYTIGLGDTTEMADALIQDIRVNRTSFTGNSFPVEIDTRFIKLKDQSLRLVIEHENEIVAETVTDPSNNDYFSTVQFIVEAGPPGLKHYTAKIEVAGNEVNRLNNRAEFVVNVLENKQKIIILSDGSHPDIGAIKNTLEQQQSFEVSLFTEDPYPADLNEYNLVILYQLPTTGISLADITGGQDRDRVPLLFIVGSKTFIPQLNALSTGIEIETLAGSQEEAQASLNPLFATFELSENLTDILPLLPPLQVPFANYNPDHGFDIFLYQKINNIQTTKPLIATGFFNGRKTGFIFGEGIWRWRLYDYYLNNTHSEFNELIYKLVQFLALRENEDNFMVSYKSVYDETEDVILTAEVYNDAFEKITHAEVIITIKNDQGDELNFTFDAGAGYYILNAGNLPVGNYSFNAEVVIGNDMYTETGKFTVTAVNIEKMTNRANHRMLYQLAGKSGGEFILPGETDRLAQKLKDDNKLQPLTYTREYAEELLNIRWLFFVFLVMLDSEWFLRKYWGLY